MATEAEAQAAAAAAVTVSEDGTTATVDRDALAEARAAEAAKAESDQLLAGKYKTTEDLVAAYKELEGKLGQKSEPTPEAEPAGEAAQTNEDNSDADPVETVYGKVVADAIKAAEVDIDAATAEFTKDGKLSDETMAKFATAGFPAEVVNAYLKGAQAPVEEAKEMAAGQIETIKTVAGGEEGFKSLQDYIVKNFTPEEKAAYNTAVGSGDFEKAIGAVVAADMKRKADLGTEGDLVGGDPVVGGEGYKDEAEVQAAMRDPRYKKSPAYRAEVEAKIAKSTFYRTR